MYPDYGLFMKNSRLANPDTVHHYNNVPVDHFTVVSRDTFCTTKNIVHAGKEYALTLDFSRSQVERLLALAPEECQGVIRSQVLGRKDFPKTVDLPVPFRVSVAARLGELQRGALEDFIPFVVAEVGPVL